MSEAVRHSMKIPNSTAHLAAVREVVGDLVRRSAYPVKKDAGALTLAVDEAVTNVMEHAYEGQPAGGCEIEVDLSADDRCFAVTLRDRGRPFDPGAVHLPEMRAHVQAGRKHGLGLFLIRTIMDEINYTFGKDGWNELRMVRFAERKR
jgi:serine/threonine-protein kinase RsbW